MRFDVIIIGGGLSGLTAGIALSKASKKVVIISAGQNSLHFHSGSFDLLGYTPNGKIVDKPLDGMQTLGVNHPYVKIGIDNIPLLADKAQELLTEAGVKVIGNTEQNHYRLTPVGVMKPTWLTAEELVISETYNRLPWKKVDIVNIKGFLDFPTAFLAAGLNKYATECEIKTISTKVTDNARRSPTEMRATNIAKYLSKPQHVTDVAREINRIATDFDAVLLPAVLGLTNDDAVKLLRKSIHTPIEFVATVPGIYIQNRLRAFIQEHGAVILNSDTVDNGIFEDGRLTAITTEKLEETRLTADQYVLATGSFISGGLVSNYLKVSEPVFNLDVEATENREQWTSEYLFDEQQYMAFGVKTDDDFHTIKDGKTIENLFAIGSVLSGNNSIKQANGTGVSMLTAIAVTHHILNK